MHSLNARLRRLNGVGKQLGFDGHCFIHAHAVHHRLQTLPAEQPHQVVLQRDDKFGHTGVALTAGAAAQLVIDAAAFMPLGAQDVKAAGLTHLFRLGGDLLFVLGQQLLEAPAGGQDLLILRFAVGGCLVQQVLLHALAAQGVLGQILGVAAQHDIGAAARHVGGNGDRPGLTGLCDDLRLLFVVLGVQHLVGNAAGLQHLAEHFGFFDGGGTHQNGLLPAVAFRDDIQNGGIFAPLRLIHGVGQILTDQRFVGGQLHHIQSVDIPELLLLGHGGTGHACQLAVHPEVVLEGNGGQGAVFPCDGDMFLGLDGLVQAVGIAPADHQAAGELIDDDDFAVLNHIVDIPLHDAAGGNGLVDVMRQRQIFGVVQTINTEVLLRFAGTLRRNGGGTGLFIHDVIRLNILLVVLGVHLLDPQRGEGGGKAVGLFVQVGGFFPGAADDQGGPGLIDKDGVHLIHDGVVPAALDAISLIDHHVIPQVVKAEFVVGAVGNIGVVGGALFLGAHAADHQPYAQAHPAVQVAHPLAVAAGQVFVDGDDVHALAAQRVKVGGQGGHQRFAFAGLHFRNAALVQNDAAHDLYGEVTHPQHPVGGLPAGGKGLRQDVLQRFALCQQPLQTGGFPLQRVVIHGAVMLLQAQHSLHLRADALELLGAVGTEQFINKSHIGMSLLYHEIHRLYLLILPPVGGGVK